jgi:ribosomal-protein-alanine N-acetyltransferase
MTDFVEAGPLPRNRVTPGYVIEPMRGADIEEILEIERATFRFPWSERAFSSELTLPYAVWRVVRMAEEAGRKSNLPSELDRKSWLRSRRVQPGPLVGYAGFQAILDEGHIMNVAVHPDYRRRGIGELLLLDLYDQARPRGVLRLSLEVRASNLAAQGLYRKYGFQVEGRRLRYYGDGEDALIMWTDRLDLAEVRAHWEELRHQLWQRIG